MNAPTLATKGGVAGLLTCLLTMGAMCPECGHGTRKRGKWLICKACGHKFKIERKEEGNGKNND